MAERNPIVEDWFRPIDEILADRCRPEQQNADLPGDALAVVEAARKGGGRCRD